MVEPTYHYCVGELVGHRGYKRHGKVDKEEKHDISHNGGGLLGVECPGENPGHYLGHVVAEYAAGDKSQNEPAQGCQLVDNAFDKTVNQCSSRYY